MKVYEYYELLAVGWATLALLVVPPLVKFSKFVRDGEMEREAFKQRVAARLAAGNDSPAAAGDDGWIEEER